MFVRQFADGFESSLTQIACRNVEVVTQVIPSKDLTDRHHAASQWIRVRGDVESTTVDLHTTTGGQYGHGEHGQNRRRKKQPHTMARDDAMVREKSTSDSAKGNAYFVLKVCPDDRPPEGCFVVRS